MKLSTIRKVVRPIAAVLLIVGLAIGWRWKNGNFGAIEPGRVYRSAQLTPTMLSEAIREYGVKTVLNLRGPNPEQDWYQGERDATLNAGATQIDVPMASDQWLSHAQVRTLLEILDTCEYPVLIHCEWGAERTGLVSAIVELLRPDRTVADARAQFSLRYLFLPIKDGLVMRGHLDRYEQWLESQKLPHSPERFRNWITNVYRPGSPSREYWPCNPYPLKVVTTRNPRGGREISESLPVDACPKTIASGVPEGATR